MSGDTAPRKIGRGYARNLNAGPFQPMIGSFDLHLRAEHCELPAGRARAVRIEGHLV